MCWQQQTRCWTKCNQGNLCPQPRAYRPASMSWRVWAMCVMRAAVCWCCQATASGKAVSDLRGTVCRHSTCCYTGVSRFSVDHVTVTATAAAGKVCPSFPSSISTAHSRQGVCCPDQAGSCWLWACSLSFVCYVAVCAATTAGVICPPAACQRE